MFVPVHKRNRKIISTKVSFSSGGGFVTKDIQGRNFEGVELQSMKIIKIYISFKPAKKNFDR